MSLRHPVSGALQIFEIQGKKYRADLWMYKAVARKYIALLREIRALLWKYRALLWKHRARVCGVALTQRCLMLRRWS